MHAPIAVKYSATWQSFLALETITDEWRDLSARAIEPNVFYEPAFALPGTKVFGRRAGAVLVRANSGRLVGLFPMHCAHMGLVAGYVHPYAPLGVPLVDRTDPEGAIRAWLDHLSQSARVILLPQLADGPFSSALDRVIAQRDLPAACLFEYRRAMLEPGADRERYLERTANTKGRKGLLRRRRRLSEMGALSHRTVRDTDAMRAMVGDFLTLEARGWKGRAGTAAQRNPALAQFVESAVLALARQQKAYGEVLSLNDKPIAATIIMRSGNAAWAWKIAYDEDYARCSPGMQIAFEATKILLADRTITRTDSCTPPDLPMIDYLWEERLAVSDRLVGLAPGGTFAFRMHWLNETVQRAVKNSAKSFLRRVGLR
jgi:CelD/BcsL family acetyltransferase involved in cellulose biosynthesis